jgi:hypothetical protein
MSNDELNAQQDLVAFAHNQDPFLILEKASKKLAHPQDQLN